MHSTGAPATQTVPASADGTAAGAKATLGALARRLRLAWRMHRSKLAAPGAFAAEAYLAANPDVASAGLPALAHYLLQGWAEGRPLRPGPHEPPRLPLSAVLGWRDWLRARLRGLLPRTLVLRPAVALDHGMAMRLRTARGPLPRGWCTITALGGPAELLILTGGRTLGLHVPAAPAAILAALPEWPAQLALRRPEHAAAGPVRPLILARELGRAHTWWAGRLLPRQRPWDQSSYQAWVSRYDTPTDAQRAAMAARAARLQRPPGFCLRLARPGTPADHHALIKATKEQLYPFVRLDEAPRPDEFAVILQPGARLAPHALLLVAEAIAADPALDLLYGDEDRLEAGARRDPWFKPDCSPERLAEQDLFGAVGVVRAGLLAAEPNDAPPDWTSLARGRRVGHVPHILTHATRPLSAPPCGGGASAFAERPWPAVTAIVPTRDQPGLLEICLAGLLDATDYPALRILVADNGSVAPATAALLSRVARRGVDVLTCPGPFNFAAINNAATAAASSELLLFLNNDVAVPEPGWLKQMVRLIQPGVGAVGARLLYPRGTLQHGGVVLGMGGIAGHAHLGAAPDDPGYGGRLRLTQEVAAVTGACMLVPARHFAAVGGFAAAHLPVAFNDVDLCLRLRRAGLRILWTPHATLYHHESASRGSDFARERLARFAAEIAYMQQMWGAELTSDPFFSPNLSLDTTDPGYAFPPRVPRPWAA